MEQSDYDKSMKEIVDFLKENKKKSLIIHLCDCGVLHWVSSKEIDINQTFVCTCGKKYNLTAMEKKEKKEKTQKNSLANDIEILESLKQKVDYAFRKILDNKNFSIEVSDNYFKDVLSELIVGKCYRYEDEFFYNFSIYRLGYPATLVFERIEYVVKRVKESIIFEFSKVLTDDERISLTARVTEINRLRGLNIGLINPENACNNIAKLFNFAILSISKEEFKSFLKEAFMDTVIYEKQIDSIDTLYSKGSAKIFFGFNSFEVTYNPSFTIFKFIDIIDDEDYKALKSRDVEWKH